MTLNLDPGHNYTGFRIESALSLGSGLWQPITNVVTVSGAVFSVAVSTTNADKKAIRPAFGGA